MLRITFGVATDQDQKKLNDLINPISHDEMFDNFEEIEMRKNPNRMMNKPEIFTPIQGMGGG